MLKARMPRWVYLLWIWSAWPLSMLIHFTPESMPLASRFKAFANSNLSEPWGLPAGLALFLPSGTPFVVQAIPPLVFTLAAHVAIRRFVPERSPAWLFAAFLVGWTLTAMLVFAAWVGLVMLTT
jgi:hypothetical protein